MKTFVKVNAIIIAAGLVIAVVGCMFFSLNWKSYSANGYTVSYEEIISVDDWNKADTLRIDMGFASLHIMKGKEVKLVADEVPEKLSAHLTADENVIRLSSGSFKAKDLLKSSGIKFDSDCKYTLYIPDYIENLEIDFSFGELTITDIYADKAEINVSYSDSEINMGVNSDLDITSSFGDTDIDLITRECRNFSLDSSFGDCDVTGARITGRADITNSFGDTDVQLLGDDYHISGVTSFGDYSSDGSKKDGSIRVNVTNSFGDVDVYTDDVPKFLN